MAEPQVTVAARVSPALNDRAQAIADRYMEGNRTRLVRTALATYCDLREALGPRFELTLAELKGEVKREGVRT